MMVEYKISMTGTLRKNKPQIPTNFLQKKPERTNYFAFDHNKVLLSHAAKKKRTVLLFSTHGSLCNNKINAVSRKPNLTEFYNATKWGIDTFDQFCSNYIVYRKTRRWPFHIFYGIVDMGSVNAMILYSLNFKKTN